MTLGTAPFAREEIQQEAQQGQLELIFLKQNVTMSYFLFIESYQQLWGQLI